MIYDIRKEFESMENSKENRTTPLSALCRAVCRQNESRLFQNQVVMYQLLIPFVSNQLISFSNNYAPETVDDLISDIRRYLVYMYKTPGNAYDSEESDTFKVMHRYIYDNIANHDSGREMPPYRGDNILSVTDLRGEGNLESNISNVIKNRRSLPVKLKKLIQLNTSNYTIILYRFFWMLQYYFVYYGRNVCSISYADKPFSHAATQFIEYFSLNEQKSRNVYAALKKHCHLYTDYFYDTSIESIDLLSLSRIILDIIIEQINLRKRIQLEHIENASDILIKDEQIITESDQFAAFERYIDGYGTDSYDRYNILLKFAPTNCYAANEPATMYYWGKTYWISDNNYFELEQNYKKAAEWYIKAIKNSNPPLQNACWSLSYTLTNIHYDTDEERESAEQKAIEYLKLAGEYPAAYNRIAWFLFRDAEELFREYEYDDTVYEDILKQFLSAIRLADRAGEMHCFYGNNQIALFLLRHKNDTKLLNDLKKRLNLYVDFDPEAQLKYAVSYHNPWALKHLAIYCIDMDRKPEAEALLLEAMKANYNAAYYEYAKNFYEPGSSKWKELMAKASADAYPQATCELAMLEENAVEKERLICLCKQQIFSRKQLDTELLERINTLEKSM